MCVQAAAKLADICRAIIPVVTLRVRGAAVVDGPVMTLIACATEVRGAGVGVITVLGVIAAAWCLQLATLIGVGEAYRLGAGVVVLGTLV